MSLSDDRNPATGDSLTTLDRVWEATRPPEPSAASWERLWAGVTAAIHQGPSTIPMRPASRVSRLPWAWIALASVAQAAAVLIAGMIFLQTRGTAPVSAGPAVAAVVPPAAPVALLDFNLDEGQTLVVRVGERSDHLLIEPKTVDTASLMVADLEDSPTDPYADAIAFSMDILNVMEAIDDSASVVDAPADNRERVRQSTSL